MRTLARTTFAGWVTFSCVQGCAAPQYRSDQRAALVAPVQLADGDTGKPTLAEDPEHQVAQRERDKDAPPKHGYAPDPEPLAAKLHHKFGLHFLRGELRVETLVPVRYPTPVASARAMGRFAIELWIGRELLERTRFDFPLLGAPAEPSVNNGDVGRPNLDSGADVSRNVQIAFSDRATRAVVVDRATGHTWDLRWPPEPTGFEAYAPTRVEAPPSGSQ